MRQRLYIFILLCINLMSFSQGKSDLNKFLSRAKNIENFDSLKVRHKLLHFPQTGFLRTYTHKYKSIIYQYSCRNNELDVEIRYLVLDLNIKPKDNGKAPNWEHIAKSNLENILQKIAKKGSISKPSLMPHSERKELCSFWGMTSDFVPKQKFSKKYKHVLVSSVINTGKSQIITFVLHNEHQKKEQLFSPYFYSLSFCEPWKTVYRENTNPKKEAYPGEKDFYFNSSKNGFIIRKEDKNIKNVYVTITDNMANIYFQDKMEGKYLTIKTLKKGEYILKINYDGKQLRRIINVFFEK